jgi:hypothetical protein
VVGGGSECACDELWNQAGIHGSDRRNYAAAASSCQQRGSALVGGMVAANQSMYQAAAAVRAHWKVLVARLSWVEASRFQNSTSSGIACQPF